MHPKAQAIHPRKERIYVKVNSDTDTTGFTQPKTITWADGRTFNIEEVRDYRPADTVGLNIPGTCYTVIIKGQEKHLFYEPSNGQYSKSRTGRWFVEVTA